MQGTLEVLVVGRASACSHPDIELPASEDTVGRRHAEITVGSGGDCYIVDLGSSNGTFVAENGKWRSIQQSSATLSTPIRLGSYETTISSLLRFRRQAAPPPLPTAFLEKPQPNRRRRRNPATGEIE